VVNLVYCDAGASGNVKADIGELMIFIQRIPEAYVRIIRRRIAETRELAAQLAEESAEGSREN
jgi:hypothetical protein